jgi:anti-sigma regulatory factor (Ser/Thr protein kinase)
MREAVTHPMTTEDSAVRRPVETSTGVALIGVPQTAPEDGPYSATAASPRPGDDFGAGASAPDASINGDLPRIAIYIDPHSPPYVVAVADYPLTEDYLPQLIETVAVRAHSLAREQGGRLPLGVFRELVSNLVHASFAGVIVTVLDGGNTVRVSDRGPGIPDKDAALRPGFTSADATAKRFIRGVGSGFSVVKETLASLGGDLEIEDNLGRGTVVTARVPPEPNISLAPAPLPSYNLPERQLKTLLLTVELAPVGPTRVAQELGVSTSTAYRDLVSLEGAGFVTSGQSGHRSVTDEGLAYLNSVL